MVEKAKVMSLMQKAAGQELSFGELARELGVKGKRRKKLGAIIDQLMKEGKLEKSTSRRYRLPVRHAGVSGRLQVHPRGYAFLLPDDEGRQDVFVPASGLGTAMHRDRVEVRLRDNSATGEKPEGKVISILERANTRVVGYFNSQGKRNWVQPLEQRLHYPVRVESGGSQGARDGDIVAVEITAWPGEKSPLRGKVSEVFGASSKPGGDILGILARLGVRMEWPREVQEEVKRVPGHIGRRQRQGRWDLRDQLLVTIDGADAKDLDDALSLRMGEDGTMQLGVHIADVSHYVRPGTALDTEAWHRGCSVYPVDRVVPMLPPELSNGICSLNAGEERLALTLLMELDSNGRVLSYQVGESVIKVSHRLTYQYVDRRLEELAQGEVRAPSDLDSLLLNLAGVARTLKQGRDRRGALDFAFGEQKVVLDADGKPVALEQRSRGQADSIVEECMILANETIARHLAGSEAPGLFRVHARPEGAELESAREVLHNLGLTLPPGDRVKPKTIQKILRAASRRPEATLVNQLLLRTLPRAVYSSGCEGHFGLASHHYTHFTSPIRRYPDLVVHRVLKEMIRGKQQGKMLEELGERMPEIAQQSTCQEQLAVEAERESVQRKVVEYMQGRLGEVYAGTVVGVTGFGLFVELENGAEGLLHISNLTDDYYHLLDDRITLQGERTRKRWRVGDQLWVRPVRADLEARTLDLEPVAQAAAVP